MNAGEVITTVFWTGFVGAVAWGVSCDVRSWLDDRRSARLVRVMCDDGRARKMASCAEEDV